MLIGFGKSTTRRAGVTLLVAVFAAAALASDPDSGWAKQAETIVSNYYQDAQTRYDKGDYEGAVIQLKNALQQNSANLSARILIGRAYLQLGDPFSAEKELRHARVEGADEELLIVPLASAMFALKRYREVLDELSVNNRSEEVEAGLRVVRGQCFLALGELTKAESEFRQSEELRPDAAMPTIGLARVSSRRGNMLAAKKRIERALEKDPENFFAWFINGTLARRLGDIRAALYSFDKSLALNADHAPARLSRARLLVETGRIDEAAEDLKILKEILPDNPFTAYIEAFVSRHRGDKEGYLYALDKSNSLLRGMDRDELLGEPSQLLLAGVVNYALGNYNDAHNYLREHIARDQFNAGSRALLGRILLRRGAVNDALTMLRTAVDLAPSDPELQRLVGLALMRLGQHYLASEAFEKAIELAPGKAKLRTNLALNLLHRGKSEEAVETLEEALASADDIVEPAMMLGLINLRNGKYDEALNALNMVVARDPDNPLVYNLLSSVYWGKGERETARRNLERAIQLDPDYVSAHRNLARMDLREGNVAAAKERFRSMVTMPGAGVGPLIDLANIEEDAGNLREAVSLLTKAQNEAPDKADAQIKLVSLLARMGDGDAAVRAARKLDNKVADDPAVLEVLGKTELAFGKVEDAANAFRRLAKIVPDDPKRQLHVARLQVSAEDLTGAHVTLKRALVSHENDFPLLEALVGLEARLELYEDALLRTEQVIKRFPKKAVGFRIRGDVLVRMRKFDDAALLYAEAIERNPSGPLFVRQYMARRAAGIQRPSLKALEDWVAAHPEDYPTRRTLATGYLDAGERAKATALNEKLASEQPRDPVVLNNLAWLYFEDGDPRALEFAEKAYRLAPKQAQTLDTLGWILVQSGDVARGLELLRDAFVRDSREPTLRYHLAFALSRQGHAKEAKKHLKALLSAENVTAEIETKSRALLATLKDG